MEQAIAAVRTFNRFYTRRVGALNARFLGTELTLPEARLLFEIAHAPEPPLASELQRTLGMDAGYVSRVMARFEARGWITREAGGEDARRRPITLTGAGATAFDEMDGRQRDEVIAMLSVLTPTQQGDLAAALGAARTLLDPAPTRHFTMRTFRAGDVGLLAARQSILYLAEYGWGRGLEQNIAETCAAFLANYREGRDQCWIAEVAGAMAGSIMLTDEGDGLSRLRLFYVEPMARGRGIGDALVSTCLGFAREKGYREMMLWTHQVLTSARRIYAAYGFEITETEMHDDFGKPELGEIWRLKL
jgi:DNA-binding MarR family transcriptional regulator/N-acetylglutamate synthase-like GNAT family acetyltransferase